MQLKIGKERVLVIPDMQIPHHHPDALDFLKAVEAIYETTKTVNIGDSLDLTALSRFVRDPDGMSAGDEYKASLPTLEKMYSLFPEGVECYSNHNGRLYDRAMEIGIPRSFVKNMQEIMGAPKGWDFKWEHEIDGVKYVHGDGFGGTAAAREAAIINRQSTVIGHHHSHGAIYYIANNKEMIFGMNAGCLINVNAYAFAYGKKNKFKPTLGCGVVLHGVPHFVPLITDKNGSWTGEII